MNVIRDFEEIFYRFFMRRNSYIKKNWDKVIVFITCPNEKVSEEISAILLEKRLAACINITNIKSFYWWKGKKESSHEIMMIIKTKDRLLKELTIKVLEAHPYDLPEIIAIPIVGGSNDYLKWIENETKS